MTSGFVQNYIEYEARFNSVISAEASGRYVRGSDGSGWDPTISITGSSVVCGMRNVFGATSLSASDTCVYTAVFENIVTGERYTWVHNGVFSGTANSSDIREIRHKWE